MKSRLVCHVVRSFLTGFLFLIGFLCLPAAYAGDGVTTWDPPAQDGTQQDPYQISTMEHLMWMEEQINTFRNPFTGKYFKLRSDFDLDSKPWNPLGFSNEYFFNGHFDGKDHTISNLYIHVEGSNGKMLGVGFFGVTGKDAVIQNLKIDDVAIYAENNKYIRTGVFAGSNLGTISGCEVKLNATIYSYSPGAVYGFDSFSGGICGESSGDISNCTVTMKEGALISSSTYYARYDRGKSYSGGICGVMTGTISNCTVTMGNNTTISAQNAFGGICGKMRESALINDCVVTVGVGSTISCSHYYESNFSGGICGYNDGTNATISGCTVTLEAGATISATTPSISTSNTSHSGGICGYNDYDTNAIITDCIVTLGENASISATGHDSYSGGICGYDYVANATITDCIVTLGENASISANDNSGGICGRNGKTISGCTVILEEGATISANTSGGICGQNSESITISHCAVTMGNNATIISSYASGGIFGQLYVRGINNRRLKEGSINISDCVVTMGNNATISSQDISGGICAETYADTSTLSNCTVSMDSAIILAKSSYGGICGENNGTNATISGCTVTLKAGATISATSTNSNSYSGGICGMNGNYNSTNATISGCTVTLGENATISANDNSGGICGYNDGTIKCVDVYKDPTAKIEGKIVGDYVGGGTQPQDKTEVWHVTDINGEIPNHAGCFYVKAGAISLSGGESYAIQTVNNVAFPSWTAFRIDTAYTDSSYFDVNERGVISMKVGAPQKAYIVPVVIKIPGQPGFLTANYRAIPSEIYIAAPLFSVASKNFSDPFDLTLTCTTAGADIYYVMNGGNMETDSILYTTPITISETTTVKAYAYKAGCIASDSVTHTYTYQKPKPPAPDQPKAEVSQGEKVPVNPTDFGVEELTKKSKLEAIYDVPFKEGFSKKLSVKMNSDGTTMEIKGAVKLTNTKVYKELKKEVFTRDILEADSVMQNVQKHAVLLTVSVKVGKERSDSSVTIALTPAHLDTPKIISINLTDSKKQVDYVILNGTNLCSKSKAWLEYKVNGKIKKLSANRVKETQYPSEVKSALPPNGETAVFKLHKKFHDNTLGRIDIVLDNKNGLAAQTLIP